MVLGFKTMKHKRRRPRPEMAALRFLIEDFADVPSDLPTTAGVAEFAKEASRTFEPRRHSVLAKVLETMAPADLLRLRSFVRNRLRVLARGGSTQHRVTLTLLVAAGEKPAPGPILGADDPRDMLWFYVANLVSRAGTSWIKVCPAPASKRENGGETICGRLYIRRGRAKRYCSERCRARVAAQRNRPAKRRER